MAPRDATPTLNLLNGVVLMLADIELFVVQFFNHAAAGIAGAMLPGRADC